MEIKTKFDIGQTVWFVDYKHNDVYHSICEGTTDNPPVGVSHGKIAGFSISSGDAMWFVGKNTDTQHFIVDEKYTISYNINERCIRRTADKIYSTQEEAEQALRIAEHKYHIDKMDELLAVKALLDELTERAEEKGIIPKVVGVDEEALELVLMDFTDACKFLAKYDTETVNRNFVENGKIFDKKYYLKEARKELKQ